MEKKINRELTEFISLYTERPMDVIREAATFMTNVARRSNFVIFQSNFGFCDNDTPFTCVVKRTPVTENGERCIFDVEFWSVDWSSFDIEDGPASDKLTNEWTLTRPDYIEGWQNLTAREIIDPILPIWMRPCSSPVGTPSGRHASASPPCNMPTTITSTQITASPRTSS